MSTVESSLYVETGEVRLVYHSSMAVSASGKNSDRLRKIARYLPDFPNGPGLWILKYPYLSVKEQAVETPLGEVISVGGKRKSATEKEGEKKAKIHRTQDVKPWPSQSQAMTKNMARQIFDHNFINKLDCYIKQMDSLQESDDKANKTVHRSIFIPASSINCSHGIGTNKKKVELAFGVNVTNYSIVKAKTTRDSNPYQDGPPKMLAQIMLKEKNASEKTPPIAQFACPTTDMMKILKDPKMIALVARYAAENDSSTKQEVTKEVETKELETKEKEVAAENEKEVAGEDEFESYDEGEFEEEEGAVTEDDDDEEEGSSNSHHNVS